jgi:hypothetical protein
MGGSATKEAVVVELGSRRLRVRQHIADSRVGQIFLAQECGSADNNTDTTVGAAVAGDTNGLDYFALKRCLCPATADPLIHSVVQTEADFYVCCNIYI